MAKYRQPRIGADCIIIVDEQVVLVRRRYEPGGWALPGGLVEEGETVESTVRREMKEETGLELLDLRLFGVYSEPGRDPRFDCLSVVFTARGAGEMRPGDDAADARLFLPAHVPWTELAFDHARILADFLQHRSRV